MIWNHNWGSLYSAGEPLTYDGKIAKLEAELKKIPAAALATNNMMSYHGDKAFPEPKWQSFGKKTFGKFESFGDFEEKVRGVGWGGLRNEEGRQKGAPHATRTHSIPILPNSSTPSTSLPSIRVVT